MLKNKKIVVVGGSSGIGFAVAQKAVDVDAEVVIENPDWFGYKFLGTINGWMKDKRMPCG